MIGMDEVLRRQDRVGRTTLSSGAEHADLLGLVLDHRLDHQVPVGEVGDVGAVPQPALRGLPVRRRQLARLAPRAERLLMRASASSAGGSLTSQTITSQPLRAPTSAIPEPMMPPPTTPTFSTWCPWCLAAAGAERIALQSSHDRAPGSWSPGVPSRATAPPLPAAASEADTRRCTGQDHVPLAGARRGGPRPRRGRAWGQPPEGDSP